MVAIEYERKWISKNAADLQNRLIDTLCAWMHLEETRIEREQFKQDVKAPSTKEIYESPYEYFEVQEALEKYRSQAAAIKRRYVEAYTLYENKSIDLHRSLPTNTISSGRRDEGGAYIDRGGVMFDWKGKKYLAKAAYQYAWDGHTRIIMVLFYDENGHEIAGRLAVHTTEFNS